MIPSYETLVAATHARLEDRAAEAAQYRTEQLARAGAAPSAAHQPQPARWLHRLTTRLRGVLT